MLRDLIMRYNSENGGRVQQVERDLEDWDILYTFYILFFNEELHYVILQGTLPWQSRYTCDWYFGAQVLDFGGSKVLVAVCLQCYVFSGYIVVTCSGVAVGLVPQLLRLPTWKLQELHLRFSDNHVLCAVLFFAGSDRRYAEQPGKGMLLYYSTSPAYLQDFISNLITFIWSAHTCNNTFYHECIMQHHCSVNHWS